MESLTNQEIFTRAYLGLASQGFERCMDGCGLNCIYADGKGKHCAWGWVDTKLDADIRASVQTLVYRGHYGDPDNPPFDVAFAQKLQVAHDEAPDPETVKASLHALARVYGLTIPEVPQ